MTGIKSRKSCPGCGAQRILNVLKTALSVFAGREILYFVTILNASRRANRAASFQLHWGTAISANAQFEYTLLKN
jgi:hypothetical protein